MLQVSADEDLWFAQQGLPSNLLTWSEQVDQEELDLLEETPSTSMDLRSQEGMLRTKSSHGLSWGDAVYNHFTNISLISTRLPGLCSTS